MSRWYLSGLALIAVFALSLADDSTNTKPKAKVLLAKAPAKTERLDPKGVDFFEKNIRPVLVQQCYKCHSATAKEPKGGLRLDTRDGLRKGGESGLAVVPGQLDDSLLISAIRQDGDAPAMPPNDRLPDNVIEAFEKWVLMGAPDPRGVKPPGTKKGSELAEARKFWAFRPPRRVPPAEVKLSAWPRTDIDRYLLAAMETEGLHPVADADRYTLLRRATFDLTGLPPTPEEMAAFVSDKSADAFAKVVDRLLASAAFGERWGRHWLDIARYGESTGKERNVAFPMAWRYRDYVIDSFNADKPYHQFLREQIAGDLLQATSTARQNEYLTATGFLALGTKSLNERNREQFLMDVADEQMDVVTRAVLGVTVTCARCHDHKFDPFSQADYYALAGIFRSTETLSGVKQGNNKTGYTGDLLALAASAKESALSDTERDELRRLEAEVKELKAQAAQKAAAAAKPAEPAAPPAKTPAPSTAKAKKKKKDRPPQKPGAAEARRIAELQDRIDTLRAKATGTPDMVMAVRDNPVPINCAILARGEINERGAEVPRGFPAVLSTAASPKVNPKASGRLELAHWVAQSANPLTARVMANRIWAHLFGTGIVATLDNFGELGDRPSHPELLDYLALRFVEHGWSVKKLIREIVLSRAYQLASTHDDSNYSTDPENRLLWRMTRRRLEAECIRDAMLAASGQLDPARPSGSPTKEISGEIGRNANTAALRRDVHCRSVYLPMVRGLVPELLAIFDMADPNLVVGQREVTTVATQALYLMNSPFVAGQAEAMAARLLARSELDEARRVDLAYRLALGRPANATECQRAQSYIRTITAALENAGVPQGDQTRRAWASLCQALFGSGEFRYAY
jgi:cytochrome c553